MHVVPGALAAPMVEVATMTPLVQANGEPQSESAASGAAASTRGATSAFAASRGAASLAVPASLSTEAAEPQPARRTRSTKEGEWRFIGRILFGEAEEPS
jgi:hypothetical protein